MMFYAAYPHLQYICVAFYPLLNNSKGETWRYRLVAKRQCSASLSRCRSLAVIMSLHYSQFSSRSPSRFFSGTVWVLNKSVYLPLRSRVNTASTRIHKSMSNLSTQYGTVRVDQNTFSQCSLLFIFDPVSQRGTDINRLWSAMTSNFSATSLVQVVPLILMLKSDGSQFLYRLTSQMSQFKHRFLGRSGWQSTSPAVPTVPRSPASPDSNGGESQKFPLN